jgi:tetratricopeptide (TPR) repeat protein
MRLTGISFVLSLAAAVYVPTVYAQSDPDPEPPAVEVRTRPSTPGSSSGVSSRDLAIIHYERGRTAYIDGRYRLAVFELETAYSLDPTGTNLLLNLGMVHERLGHIDDALLSYERLLAATTNADERVRTQRVITRLRGARRELADMSRRNGRADGLFWAVTGGAFASAAIGATMFLTQRAGANDNTAPVVFSVTSGALGLFALVLYLAREAPERHSLFVEVIANHSAGALTVTGTF